VPLQKPLFQFERIKLFMGVIHTRNVLDPNMEDDSSKISFHSIQTLERGRLKFEHPILNFGRAHLLRF